MNPSPNQGESQNRYIDQNLCVDINFIPITIDIITNYQNAPIPQAKLKDLRTEITNAFEMIKDKKQQYSKQHTLLNKQLKDYYDNQSNDTFDANNSEPKELSPAPPYYSEQEDHVRNKRNSHNHKGVNKIEQMERGSSSIQRANLAKNPLNIWNISEKLFRPLPSSTDITHLFAKKIPIIDSHSINSLPRNHWSQKFSEFAERSKCDALQPPVPAIKNMFSQYWKQNPPTFQIESIEHKKATVFHYLLSALVDAKPIKKTEQKKSTNKTSNSFYNHKIDNDDKNKPKKVKNKDNDTQANQQNDNHSSKDRKITSQRGNNHQNNIFTNHDESNYENKYKFNNELNDEIHDDDDDDDTYIFDQHTLLPSIDCGSYLCHGFETRLRLELESAGLGIFEDDLTDCIPFQIEINETRREIEEHYQPEIDFYHQMILDKLPEMRHSEETRANNQTIYRMMKKENANMHTRKK
ncbi:hypothetical protein TRFO_06980 [Tritrichomonas foetus]|uniref:Uncharacterized protein n=1 Tax=Tritrichomonas foetus TaxID=1144522 RepID=A0A1J4JUU1_9EUKA|nr:hypothetical protein TRFO_06980 [Tritrichomonas foetus]|eukprot:OHT02913.1 hypothetical protein TRFO_06980 [Tritrichomonas foetus]